MLQDQPNGKNGKNIPNAQRPVDLERKQENVPAASLVNALLMVKYHKP